EDGGGARVHLRGQSLMILGGTAALEASGAAVTPKSRIGHAVRSPSAIWISLRRSSAILCDLCGKIAVAVAVAVAVCRLQSPGARAQRGTVPSLPTAHRR